jgi:hypothetical protein
MKNFKVPARRAVGACPKDSFFLMNQSSAMARAICSSPLEELPPTVNSKAQAGCHGGRGIFEHLTQLAKD